MLVSAKHGIEDTERVSGVGCAVWECVVWSFGDRLVVRCGQSQFARTGFI